MFVNSEKNRYIVIIISIAIGLFIELYLKVDVSDNSNTHKVSNQHPVLTEISQDRVDELSNEYNLYKNKGMLCANGEWAGDYTVRYLHNDEYEVAKNIYGQYLLSYSQYIGLFNLLGLDPTYSDIDKHYVVQINSLENIDKVYVASVNYKKSNSGKLGVKAEQAFIDTMDIYLAHELSFTPNKGSGDSQFYLLEIQVSNDIANLDIINIKGDHVVKDIKPKLLSSKRVVPILLSVPDW